MPDCGLVFYSFKNDDAHDATNLELHHLIERIGFRIFDKHTLQDVERCLTNNECICFALGVVESVDDAIDFVREVQGIDRTVFIAIFSPSASDNVQLRWSCFDENAHMVTRCQESLSNVMQTVINHAMATRKRSRNSANGSGRHSGAFTCPVCAMEALSEDELCEHMPLFHIGAPNNPDMKCPVCGDIPKEAFAVHLRNSHGPIARGEGHLDKYEADRLYAFALVVVRHPDGRFLLVQEFASVGFWLPGGRVDPGETLCEAAIRETKEEAGIDVELTGILTMEFTPCAGYARLRVIFFGVPRDDEQLPKSIPDYESAGACWATVDDLGTVPLRGSEPVEWFSHVSRGEVVHPLSLLVEKV
eukprot:302531_1